MAHLGSMQFSPFSRLDWVAGTPAYIPRAKECHMAEGSGRRWRNRFHLLKEEISSLCKRACTRFSYQTWREGVVEGGSPGELSEGVGHSSRSCPDLANSEADGTGAIWVVQGLVRM